MSVCVGGKRKWNNTMALFMDTASDPLTESERADIVAIAAIKESAAIEFKVSVVGL